MCSDGGRKAVTEVVVADGTIKDKTEMTFDAHGNCTKYISDDGESIATIITEYKYDGHGNFTKSVETWNGELNRIVVREIQY